MKLSNNGFLRITAFLILVILFFSFKNSICTDKKDIIFWDSQRPLKWEDFKGSVPVNTYFTANSYLGIQIDYHFNRSFVKIRTNTYFDMSNSWVEQDHSIVLLKHEQAHFDLYEVYRRKLMKIYKNESYLDKSKIDYFYNKVFFSLDSITNIYDSETDYSIDTIEQKSWEFKIVGLLNELNEYKDSVIEIMY
jgi:hypothetical protein